jgi:hypothetical protein
MVNVAIAIVEPPAKTRINFLLWRFIVSDMELAYSMGKSP